MKMIFKSVSGRFEPRERERERETVREREGNILNMIICKMNITRMNFPTFSSVQPGTLVSRSIAVKRVPSIGKTTFCLGAILTSHLTMSD